MSVLSAVALQQIEQALISRKVLTPQQIKQYHDEATAKGVPFISLLVSDKHVSSETLTKIMAGVNNVPYVNLTNATIEESVLELLSQEIAERYMAVPLGEMDNRLVVAMLDADNVQAVDFLSNKIGRALKVYAASEEGIRHILAQYKNRLNQEAAGEFAEENAEIEMLDDKSEKEKSSNVVTSDSPISKILTSILEYASNNRASDVHIEPAETELKIRCRIDGVLREIMRLPKATEPPLVSRVKILSNLKIDEHRVPQDGQFTFKSKTKNIDLRVAISPVVWGEQIVIRLLDKSGTSLNLEDMGYTGRSLRRIRKALQKPNGMILTSGPTGSGKSTSMYALIQEIKNDQINIVTLEDPVEYKIAGINQIQVNPGVGLTFATGLRSVLRQDPDVVMVGEIRDKETATLAVQAALTGHLVFSTLHTNSAAGILPRLLDMGIEPFLIASTVRTVIGQRLVRKIADNKETYQSTTAETQAIQKVLGNLLPASKTDMSKVSEELGYKVLPLRGQNAYTLAKGVDSQEAPGGYKGRLGLYEVFDVSEEIQQLILKRATSEEIHKQALALGMVSMQQDGYLKALAGKTTLDEVNRVTSEDSS